MGKLLNKNLVVRTLSGIMLLVIVLGAVLASHWSFALLIAAISTGCLWEFYRIAGRGGINPQKWLGIAIGIGIVTMSYLVAIGVVPGNIMFALLAVVPVIFAVELYRKQEKPLANIGVTIGGIVYTAALSSLFFIAIGNASDHLVYQPWVILTLIFIIWANDIGAYLTGVLFGRHRLFERISPKKSWEGFFGGVIFAVATGIFMASVLEYDVVVYGCTAAVLAVSGVFGDLVESMLKREAGIKDSGAIMPGHGGFLDRFDALIFAAPIVVALSTIIAQW